MRLHPLAVLFLFLWACTLGGVAKAETSPTPPALPTSWTNVVLEGWTLRVDDRLFQAEHEELRTRALRFLEHKLLEITLVLPADKVNVLRKYPIVLDLNHGKLNNMQYHPCKNWLRRNGFDPALQGCFHIPVAAQVVTRRNINEQPWVVLHELAHAYHDQELGFDHPGILAAFEAFKASGRGEKTMLYNGRRVRHYALTDAKEFFAEMTEAYWGLNDFSPFNYAELRTNEPEIFKLMESIWGKR
jgi:hypothetical protein